ncbi:MAG: hypothetical protein J4N30_04925 [Chloroflexi bacterium]|nr:hypothetical protein [Chloroflexota bacterium]
MKRLIKGPIRKFQVCALLMVGVAFVVGCGSKPVDTPAEAAPAPVNKVVAAQEKVLDTVLDAALVAAPATAATGDDTNPGELHDLNPAPSQATPAYEPPLAAEGSVAPSSAAESPGESESPASGPTEGLVEPVVEESDQSDLFVERDAIEALGDELFLEIISPAEEVVFVESPIFVLTARTVIDAAVSVNDDLLDVDEEGIVQTELTLEEGPNIVEVVVSLSGGQEKSAVLTIFYLP